MAYAAIKVPVLPSPALQWTARAPGYFSAMFKKSATIFLGGQVPSGK